MNYNQDLLKIGKRLREYRLRAGMNQLELECAIGAASGSLSRIENGTVNPTKETLFKIMDILNISGYEAASLLNINIDELPKVIQFAKNLSLEKDLDKIVKTAVTEVVDTLKLLGCIIFLKENDYVYLRNFTQAWYTEVVNKLLPAPLTTLKTSLITNKDNFIVKSINENRIMMSKDLTDFSHNVFPDSISRVMQKITNHKNALSMPLIYDSKAIGAILFSKTYLDDFSNELETLKSFADYISVLIKNAKAYDEV
jgi:transcriptional regulator with XRE-family HTH domain